MLISPDGASQGVACERCGGKRLEPDQPSPLHSDGDLRNMVDPGIGLDQGGNPNQEGIWATTDGGWQPRQRRDESFASVRTAMEDFGDMFDFESEPNLPSHHFIVDRHGGVYSGAYPQSHEAIADQHRLAEATRGVSKGALYPDGSTEFYTHSSGHSPAAMEQMLYGHFGVPAQVDPGLQSATDESRMKYGPGYGPEFNGPPQRELQALERPPRVREWGRPLDRSEGLVRGGGYERTSNQDPYLPWTHEAEVINNAEGNPVGAVVDTGGERFPAPKAPPYTQEQVVPGPLGIHAGTTKWLQFLDAYVNGVPVRGNVERIIAEHGNPMSPTFGQPVHVAAHHPEHLEAAVDVINHSSSGGAPSPKMIDVGRRVQRGELEPPPGIGAANFKPRQARMIYKAFGIGDLAGLALPAAGLALAPETGGASLGLLGGSGLLRAAAPTLMKGALMGVGSHLMQGLLGGGGGDAAGQGASMPPPPRGIGSLSRVADMETPHTTPYLHDDPDGDPHQFQDGAESPGNLEHPGTSGEAGGAAVGEDNVPPSFGPSSPSMERFNLLMPAILHYYHSDQSGAQDPMVRELHDMMDKELPGYLDHDEATGAEAVQHLVHHLRQPQGVHAKTAMQPGWNAAPGTAPLTQPGVPTTAPQMQPGMIPQQAHCAYCGGVTTADGSCPQCGAKNMPGGAQTMQGQPGAMPGQGGPMTTTPFVGKTAADTQGPVSPEQIAAVQQLLLDTGRAQEVPNVPLHPELYAKELAQVAQQDQTVPPTIDPSQQPPPPPPQMDPNQMGQMPMPGMSVPGGAPPGMTSSTREAALLHKLLTVPAVAAAMSLGSCAVHGGQCPDAPKHNAMVQELSKIVPSTEDAQAGAGAGAGAGAAAYTVIDAQKKRQEAEGHPQSCSKVATPHAGAPRCPDCNSATTGFVNGLDGKAMGNCHSCGNTWEIPEAEVIKTSAEPMPGGANPLGVPAADQQQAYDPQQDQDSSHTWVDADGEPLEEGQDYEMFTPGMSIPDRVRIDQKKPDELVYSTIGEFDPDPTNPTTQPLTYQSRMSREDFQLRGYQFQKAGDGSDAGKQNLDQYRDQSQAPVNTEPQPEPSAIQSHTKESYGGPMITEDPKGQFHVGQEVTYTALGGRPEQGTIVGFQPGAAIDPFVQNRFGQTKVISRQVISPADPLAMVASVQEDYCPKCASTELSTHMSSATREFHECYKCGHGWESKVEEYEAEGGQRRAWIMDSGSEDDDFWNGFERAREMSDAGIGSRSLAAAAARDNRASEIRDRLDANKAEREAHLAGRRFSPREQRAFVDEQGVARNADKLDLAGTHYEGHRYVDKANGANVREEDLFLGF